MLHILPILRELAHLIIVYILGDILLIDNNNKIQSHNYSPCN